MIDGGDVIGAICCAKGVYYDANYPLKPNQATQILTSMLWSGNGTPIRLRMMNVTCLIFMNQFP